MTFATIEGDKCPRDAGTSGGVADTMERADMTDSTCEISGCPKPTKSIGMCSKHYRRLRLYGDPHHVNGSTCERCGNHVRRRGRGPEGTDAERFWVRVCRGPGCWPWHGKKRSGYGRAWVDGSWMSAHRYSFVLDRGYEPDDLVLHRCGNRACVRPDHLYEGTAADNSRDRDQHGTTARGERSGAAVLTADDVREVRRLLEEGETYRAIADRMGCSKGTISAIAQGRTWTHVQ